MMVFYLRAAACRLEPLFWLLFWYNPDIMWFESLSLAQSIAALFAALATIFGPFKYAYRKFMEDRAAKAEIVHKISVIYSKLTPNGGTSIEDKMNALTGFVASGFARIEQTTKLILQITGKAYWLASPDGAICDVSPALANLFQRTPDQLTGWGWVAYIAESEVDRIVTSWETAVKHAREFRATYEISTPSNTTLRVVMHALPIKSQSDAGDEVLSGYLGWFEIST